MNRGQRIIAAMMAGLMATLWILVSAHLARDAAAAGDRWLVDADCDMRLARVREIVENGQYPFLRFQDSNPPSGESSHWGLPMDLVLIAGARAMDAGGGMDAALYRWSVWVGPALFACLAAVLAGFAVSFGGVLAAVAVIFHAAGAQALLHPFLPARPDHHGLLLVLHAFALAALCGAVLAPERRTAGLGGPPRGCLLLSAASTAIAVWTSVEACVLAGLVGGWLALRLCTADAARVNQRRRMLLDWATGFGIALAGAWLVESGGLRAPILWTTDALSARHLLAGLATLVALHACGGWLASPRAPRRLGGLACAAAAAAAAWMLPRFFTAAFPRPETDFALMFGFLDRASTDGMPLINDVQSPLGNLLLWYGLPALLVPCAARETLGAAGPKGALARFFVACGLIYLGLGFLKMRWVAYAALFYVPISACWLAGVIRRFRPGGRRPWRRALMWGLAAAGGLAVGFAGRIAASHLPDAESDARREPGFSRAVSAARLAWEQDRARRGVASRKVITHVALGPKLLYEWRAAVLATPNVRNGAGIRRLFAWLLSEDVPRTAREAAEQGWAYALVIDPPPPEVGAFRRFLDAGPPAGHDFLTHLARGDPSAVVAEWPLGRSRLVLVRVGY